MIDIQLTEEQAKLLLDILVSEASNLNGALLDMSRDRIALENKIRDIRRAIDGIAEIRTADILSIIGEGVV